MAWSSTRRWARGLCAVALPAVLVVSCGIAFLQWQGVTSAEYRRAQQANERANQPDASEESGDTKDDSTLKRFGGTARPRRIGSTTFRVTSTGEGAWRVTATHRIVLLPGDPLRPVLRADTNGAQAWIPFEAVVSAGYDACSTQALFETWSGEPLRQDGPKATAYVTADWEAMVDLGECGLEGDSSEPLYMRLTPAPGVFGKKAYYDEWTVTVAADEQAVTGVDGGTVLHMSGHRVELVLSPKTEASVTLTVPQPSLFGDDARSDIADMVWVLQLRPSALREAVFALGAVAAVGCLAVAFVRRWAPDETRHRWIAAAVTGTGLTCVLLLWAAAESGEFDDEWWAAFGREAPLMIWWQMLLPLCVAAFATRVGRGRPPQVRDLLPLLVPSALLCVPAAVLARSSGSPVPVLIVVAAGVLAGATALILRRGPLGPTGRRWAVTAVSAVWLAVLSAGPGTGMHDVSGYADVSFTDDWDAARRITALVLAWGWPGALWAVLAARGWTWWRAGLSAAVLWWFLEKESVLWLDTTYVYGLPLDFFQTATIATTLLLLWSSGREEGNWPEHVRIAVVALGTAALLTEVTLSGIESFASTSYASGPYLAVTIAALGFLWLFPPRDEPRARRLHRTTISTHTRRMYTLLKDQSLAAGRRDFLTASRTELSDGTLTPKQWSERWRELGGPAPGGPTSRRPTALRILALGTSGGRTAWRNGMAAAVLLAVLSLPWFVYTLPSRLTTIGYDVSDVVEVWSTALRWPLYGFVYGYAYSWLRGATPIGKASCLLAVVLPAELAELLYQFRDAGDFGIRLMLTSGDTVAVLLLLGLYWEVRLVRAGGLRWGQIRNFRSLSAAAVPVTTVLVAATTALATAMVGAWITPDSGPSPSPSSSVSGTPDPGGP
ncbi:hypothetical protein [Streptomyces fulvoviolaceus]|uniref:hypothetical protein n=1 Tax=Streptomyces fulvoviolaceus TaxID=285535 RepID=UPI000B020825|nr:hypothetical protein [Streptomyces fulvoviolaceus]